MKQITPLPRCIVTVTALVALVALGLDPPSPILGQTSNTTEPEVVTETPQSDPPEVVNRPPFTNLPSSTDLILIVVTIVFGVIHSVYYVVQNYRNQLCPILSWSLIDGSSKFKTQQFLGKGYKLTIQVTNVGQAAALDIESIQGVVVIERGVKPSTPTSETDYLGSLYPNVSMNISVMLSDDEYEKIMNGALASLVITLQYKTAANKTILYKIRGIYSQPFKYLYGPASKNSQL